MGSSCDKIGVKYVIKLLPNLFKKVLINYCNDTCNPLLSFTTFHLCVEVNKLNIKVWGSDGPQGFIEHVRNSPKVNFAIDYNKCKDLFLLSKR